MKRHTEPNPAASAAHPDDADGRLRPDGRVALVPLLGALAFLLWLALPLARGAMYTEDDLGCFHLPFRAAYQAALQNGHSTLWNPHVFNGFYIHGEGQIGLFHPLHWLLYRFLPLPTAFMLELLISYPMAFAGMYLLLRRWRLPAVAAAHGALLFAFLGFSMNHYVHMHFVAAFAHLPWALCCVEQVMRGGGPGRRWGGALGLALLGASQLLLGAPQPTYYSWMVEGFYAVGLLVATQNWRPFLTLGAMKGLAVLLAGVQVLPMWSTVADSYRAAPDTAFQLAISLRPWNLIQWIQPYLFEGRVYAVRLLDEPWDAPYLGAATPALMLFAAVALRGRGPLLWAAYGLMALGLLAALGGHGFLHPLLDWIPVVNKLRAPSRYVALAHVGMVFGAALGMALLARGGPRHASSAWVSLLPGMASTAVAAGVVALRGLGPAPLQETLALDLMPTTTVFFGAGLVGLASLLVFLAARGWRGALPLLLCLSLADIGLCAMRHKHSETLAEVHARIDRPPAPPGTAIDPDIHPSSMNLPMMLGYRMPYGYVALSPARRLDHTREEALRLAGVAWRRARVADPALREAALRGATWVPLPDSMPRAWLVGAVRVSEDSARDLPGIDPRQTALVDAPLPLDAGVPGTASTVLDWPGRLAVLTETPGRQVLVTGVAWHPGWRLAGPPAPLSMALAEGQRETEDPAVLSLPRAATASNAQVVRVNGDFLGVVVGPGKHLVTLAFAPRDFRLGQALSAVGVALTVMLAALGRRRARRESGPA